MTDKKNDIVIKDVDEISDKLSSIELKLFELQFEISKYICKINPKMRKKVSKLLLQQLKDA